MRWIIASFIVAGFAATTIQAATERASPVQDVGTATTHRRAHHRRAAKKPVTAPAN